MCAAPGSGLITIMRMATMMMDMGMGMDMGTRIPITTIVAEPESRRCSTGS